MNSHKEIISDWFVKYGNDIYHYLIYRSGASEAEDLLQEVFIKALKGSKTFRNRSSPKTWLFSIARNVAVDASRKQTAKKWLNIISLEKTRELKTEVTPETILQLNEERRVIYQAIQRLRPNYQDVIILRNIQELSVTETAKILKWSKHKVSSTHYRARLALINDLRGEKDE